MGEGVGGGEGVAAAAGADEGVVEAGATFADPADAAGGDASHEGVVGNILCDDGTGSDKGTATDGMTANNCAVGTERGSFTDERLGIDAMYGEVGARRGDVREDTGRTAEDIILYLHTVIDRHVVLDTNTVADANLACYIDVLTKGTVLPYHSTTLHMAKMPNLRMGTYHGTFVDIR